MGKKQSKVISVLTISCQEWGRISREEGNRRALWLGFHATELVESEGSPASKAKKLKELVMMTNIDFNS